MLKAIYIKRERNDTLSQGRRPDQREFSENMNNKLLWLGILIMIGIVLISFFVEALINPKL